MFHTYLFSNYISATIFHVPLLHKRTPHKIFLICILKQFSVFKKYRNKKGGHSTFFAWHPLIQFSFAYQEEEEKRERCPLSSSHIKSLTIPSQNRTPLNTALQTTFSLLSESYKLHLSSATYILFWQAWNRKGEDHKFKAKAIVKSQNSKYHRSYYEGNWSITAHE